jgi:hypothetical protein
VSYNFQNFSRGYTPDPRLKEEERQRWEGWEREGKGMAGERMEMKGRGRERGGVEVREEEN